MFNFCSVAVLLPIEAATGYLYSFSEALIKASPGLTKGSKPPDILKALTKPFTKAIISIDKKVITKFDAIAGTTTLGPKLDATPQGHQQDKINSKTQNRTRQNFTKIIMDLRFNT